MLDILVFTQHPNAYAPKRLETEAQLQGRTLQLISYNKIDFNKLPKARFVILREPDPKPELYKLRDRILKHYLSTNTPVLNSNSYLKWSVLDKKTQEQEFKKAKIPYLKSLELARSKFPFIAKATLGSHGDHVYKIKDEKELKEVLKKYGEDQLIFQEFLKSGFDLRVIVIDFKVVGIMKRTPKSGNFLSNYSQGGIATKLKIKNEKVKIIKQIAIKTAKHFKLDYVGVDIMLDNNGKWVVLEVNRACQFKGFEKAVKVNIAREMISFSGPH